MRKLMLIGVMCAWSLGRVNAQTNVPPSIKASSYYVYEFWDAVGTDKMWTYLGDPYEPQPPHVYVKVKEEIISWWTTDPGDPAYQLYMDALNVGTNEGSFTYWKYFGDPYNEDYSTDSYPGTGPAFEMAANGPWIHRDSGHEYYNLLIEWTPELALHTGGPTNSTANRLFKINVWARELVYESLFGFDIEDAFEILPGNIRILGQTPDESGNLYVYLADHSVVDITPSIMQTNVMSYEFNLSASLFTGSTTNTVIDCGSLLSPGLLSATNYQVCLGGSISPPTATAPLFTDGQIRSTVVDHLNGTTNTTTNSFTYTVGPLYFVPPIPPSFTNAGTHTFTAMVNLTPAITNCPVINATVGTVTVIAAQPTTNVTYQCVTVTNLPTFNLTNIVCVSNTVALPPIDTNWFLPGKILVAIVDCATGLTNTTTNAITYTPQIRVEANYPTNGVFDTPGEFQYQIYVDGISSTNACPNLTVQAGSFTVFASKMTIGLGTTDIFVNADDDNANANNDVSEALSGPDSAVTGENDLVSLSLGAQGAAPGQTATLSVSGNVRIWANSTRGPGAPVLDTANGANSVTWPVTAMPSTLWIEGVTPSVALNDVALSLTVDPPGCPAITNLTVFHLAIVADNNRDGLISLDGSDHTSQTDPFLYWANDDNDEGNMQGDDISRVDNNDSDDGGNGNLGSVDGNRDLVDFFPVYLDLKPMLTILPPSSSVKYKLKQGTAAVNFVYTSLTRIQALDHHKELFHTGFGDAFDHAPGSANTRRITATGVELSAPFLDGIPSNDWGVILVEGRYMTEAPLMLTVEIDGQVFAQRQLDLRISQVEDMFRHVNLAYMTKDYEGTTIIPPQTAAETHTGDPGAAYPDSRGNGKYFVFVHGYQVGAQQAKGWHSETFKRLFVLGSKARFVGVTWHGATGVDYHKAVFQAFQTGDMLASNLTFTAGADVTIAAHSLGNLVVGHAIQDGGFVPARYYMLNAAMATEAYDFASIPASHKQAMTEENWMNLWGNGQERLFSANWHQLFSDTPDDNRNRLTWKNRLTRVIDQQVETHNFFSPGEEVLAMRDPIHSASVLATFFNQGFDFPVGAWKAQELVKGVEWTTSIVSLLMSRGQAGWDKDGYYNSTPLADITNEELKTRPYFDEFLESDLTHTNAVIASDKAGELKVQYDLLARAIPALSHAAAVEPIPALVAVERNFDMEVDGRTSGQWPTEGHGDSDRAGKWLHNDFRHVALPYLHQLFEAMITKGNLK